MPSDTRLTEFARQMRKGPSPTEKKMWVILRDRRLAGFRFRRQHPIPPYIADYYCAVARLVIEFDGETHVGEEAADRRRQEFLEKEGYRVLRFWNTLVFEDPDSVVEAIYRACVESVKTNPIFAEKLTAAGQMTGPRRSRG